MTQKNKKERNSIEKKTEAKCSYLHYKVNSCQTELTLLTQLKTQKQKVYLFLSDPVSLFVQLVRITHCQIQV